ncbi:MAG: ATP-grasp domain-containing protein [Candidatus Bathyarchaeia archaeon]
METSGVKEMLLYEYVGKELFRRYGIPVPPNRFVENAEQAVEASERLGFPVMLKIQLKRGGRGRLGGIVKVNAAAEVYEVARKLLRFEPWGERPAGILVEKAVEYDRELYLGLALDTMVAKPVLIASASGGVFVEEDAKRGKTVRVDIDPRNGLRGFQARKALKKTGLYGTPLAKAEEVALRLYRLMTDLDADIAEINPLSIAGQDVYALDARVNIDDEALFRQPTIMQVVEKEEDEENRASKRGFTYVQLDGDIGVIAGGAGLGLATIDLIQSEGGFTASFLDIGGGITAERASDAVRVTISNPKVKALLVNIYAGINNCEDIAKGILAALRESPRKVLVVVKMKGNSEESGWAILESSGFPVIKTPYTRDAVKLLLKRMREERML